MHAAGSIDLLADATGTQHCANAGGGFVSAAALGSQSGAQRAPSHEHKYSENAQGQQALQQSGSNLQPSEGPLGDGDAMLPSSQQTDSKAEDAAAELNAGNAASNQSHAPSAAPKRPLMSKQVLSTLQPAGMAASMSKGFKRPRRIQKENAA